MKLAVDRLLRPQWQYGAGAGSLTSNDPNPPITLEDAPAAPSAELPPNSMMMMGTGA